MDRSSLLLMALLCAHGPLAAAVSLQADPHQGEEGPTATWRSASVRRGIELLIEMQEGSGPAEWPYEGVYRVRRKIPIGYRVGGTGIVASALIQAPGYAEDSVRREAVERAVEFVCGSIEHDLMDPDYSGGYDVRGWGYAYGLAFLLRLERLKLIPKEHSRAAKKAARFFIDALERIEIPAKGGWSYSRSGPLDEPSNPSPFMTAPCLQALFEAEAAGHKVDRKVVERGIAALESSRTSSGAIVYSSSGDSLGSRDKVPGAVGRMLAAEATLLLAGRGSQADVRGAVDAFLVHWRWLDKRRAQTGTHVAPYGVAPYYFYYAHYFAAQAIELLSKHERAEYRARLAELLYSVQLEDGTWNDRVFDRSANYGTAMSILALMMPDLQPPAAWARGLKKAR